MGKKPVLPCCALRLQVGVYSLLSVPTGAYQEGKKKLHFTPQDLMSFLLLPTAPIAAEICHRAKALPSVRSNSFAVGRIWHGHKGPLFVPEVGHTMQSFPQS